MPAIQITAQNQFTDPERAGPRFDVSIYDSASFVGTITLQRRRVGSSGNWRDVKTYTGPAEEFGESSGNFEYRIGCKTGGFTSGTIYVEVSK